MLDISDTRAAIQHLLSLHPELADDEDWRRDMIEAETDAFKVLGLIMEQILEARMIKAALDERAKQLDMRSLRYEAREDFMRKLAMRIMETAGLHKMVLPEATLSIRPTPQAVRILNPDMIPHEFWRVKTEPNVTAIKAALKAGQHVPGAALSNQSDVLAVFTR